MSKLEPVYIHDRNPLTIDGYQARALQTALPSARSLNYMTLGLASEAGEVAGKVKKLIRDGDDPSKHDAIAQELGDVAWYLAGCCSMLGYSLEGVMARNLDKLKARQDNGTIQGSGDNR